MFVLFRDVTGAALRELVNQGKVGKLQKFEIPGAVSASKREIEQGKREEDRRWRDRGSI